MKLTWLLLVLLVTLPVMAQAQAQADVDALLLYAAWDDSIETVYVLNADTGEQRMIAELLDAPRYSWGDAGWSPDGRYIWVVDAPSENRRRLQLVDVADWSARTITEDLLLEGCQPSLSWSPDGQMLSYFTGAEPDHQLTLLHLETEIAYTFGDLRSLDSARPVWSPDGRYLLTRAQPGSGQGENLLVDTSDGSVVMAFRGGAREFSPDGRYLAHKDLTWRLVDLATAESVDLGTSDTIDSWSPDGRYLLLWRVDEQDRAVYFTYEPQTGAFTTLDAGEPVRRIVAWAQDGAELLIVTQPGEQDGEETLRRYALASGDVTPLLESSGLVGLVSPNGSWLFVSYTGETPPAHIRITGGETVLDTELAVSAPFFADFDSPAVWSPDTRWLALRASDGIYRFDRETATLERLPIEAYRFQVPGWSADSRHLAFRVFAGDGDRGKLAMWHAAGNTVEQLPYPVDAIVGWRNGQSQDSLLYCGIG
jgi:Tol biopolymer transport system component